jgi:sugar lactone lactonase YvrE
MAQEEVKMQDGIRCVAPAGDICGEGAVWHPEQNALYWTDINRFLVHRLDASSQATTTWMFDEPVTAVNLTTDPTLLLLVLGSRIGFWAPSTHPRVETVFRLPDAPEMRCNDARVDPRGSLWVGTMRNNVGAQGEDRDVEFSGGFIESIQMVASPSGSARLAYRTLLRGARTASHFILATPRRIPFTPSATTKAQASSQRSALSLQDTGKGFLMARRWMPRAAFGMHAMAADV